MAKISDTKSQYYCYNMLIRPYQFEPEPNISLSIHALVLMPQFVFVNQTDYDLLLA